MREAGTVVKRSIFYLGIALIFICGVNFAEDRKTPGDDSPVIIPTRLKTHPQAAVNAAIRVDTKLVLIPVTVTDTFGAPYSGLARDGFHLYEDGVEQQVKYFASEDAPVSLGI